MTIARESCGCEWSEEFFEGHHVQLGWYDQQPQVYLKTCKLHARYGEHREMQGFDEGLCK